jgi:dolichyl-phosphate beta-glucosyltransferase
VTRLSVVVPAFDEARRISATVERLRAGVPADGGLEIVVVDDASSDRTAAAAREAGADLVLTLPSHRGKGAAVRAGMLAAGGQARAFTDADLAYSPEQVTRLLQEVEAGWEVVIGSRRHVEATALVRAGRVREASGRLFNLLTRLIVLDEYLDTQCGLKAFAAPVVPVLFNRSFVDGFAFDVELLYLARRYGLRLREVPVELASSTSSSVKVVRDATLMVRDLLRIRRRAASGDYDLLPDELAALGEGRAPEPPR